jgi:hypothetical protein
MPVVERDDRGDKLTRFDNRRGLALRRVVHAIGSVH